MTWFLDVHNRPIRLTDERREHIESDHPEMVSQIDRTRHALAMPDVIVQSATHPDVELFPKRYPARPVSPKHLCVVLKKRVDDLFIVTAYFTHGVKRGERIWEKE